MKTKPTSLLTAFLAALLLSPISPFAQAAQPEEPGQPDFAGGPENPGKPEEPGQPDFAGKPSHAGPPTDGGQSASDATPLVLDVTGTAPNGGTLSGELTIDEFVADGGVLKVEGTLDATITAADGTELTSVTDLAVTLAVVETNDSDSDSLVLELASSNVDINGTIIPLNDLTIEIAVDADSSKSLKRLVAQADRVLERNNANARQIARLLNVVLRQSTAGRP